MQRFGLLFWALHRLGGTSDEAYIDSWNAFASYFGDLAEAARIVDLALKVDFEEHGPWSDWVMSEFPMGHAFPAVDLCPDPPIGL